MADDSTDRGQPPFGARKILEEPITYAEFQAQYDPVHNPRPATDLREGVTLYTKDGAQIGNAIIVRANGEHWDVETDFGNQLTMRQDRILELWNLGFEQTYDSWTSARFNHIQRNAM